MADNTVALNATVPAEVICRLARARADFYAGRTLAGRMFPASIKERIDEIERMGKVMRAVGCEG